MVWRHRRPSGALSRHKRIEGQRPTLHLLADEREVTALRDHRDKAYAHSIGRAGGFNACRWWKPEWPLSGVDHDNADARSGGRAWGVNESSPRTVSGLVTCPFRHFETGTSPCVNGQDLNRPVVTLRADVPMLAQKVQTRASPITALAPGPARFTNRLDKFEWK